MSSKKGETPALLFRLMMREYVESLLVAVFVALFLRFFVISAYKIPTSSMAPTLKVGDFIFAYKLPYGFPIPFSHGDRIAPSLPARGDVVVFRYPGNESIDYVKRVIGLPGDRISIREKALYINEQPATYASLSDAAIADLPGNEFYEAFRENLAQTAPAGGANRTQQESHLVIKSRIKSSETFGPIVVPPGQIFVLGDNRDSSDDSRYWGTVPVRNLEGRVVMIWLSFDWLNRWGNEHYPSVRWNRVFQAVR